MKQSNLLFSIILLLSCSNIGFCQITIAAEDFVRESTFVDDGIIANPAGVAAPTEGANQVWDYSGLTTSEFDTSFYYDASGDVFYPDALNYEKRDLSFQGFLISNNTFEDVDSQGYYELGRSSEDISYSITAISGGANDTLAFVSNHDAHDGRIDYIQFPLNYEDEWNQKRIEPFNFELTIAAFGLNKTPGSRQRHVTQSREVVGHGQIIIPAADGSPSAPMDVLLVHVLEHQTDTFYVGGALAPAVLLGAFGLTQGASVSDEFYVFYRPGFAAPVMNFNVATTGVYYRPRAAEGISALRPINKIEVDCFPNPILRGERLTFQSDDKVEGEFQLVDMTGRVIHHSTFSSVEEKLWTINIPINLLNGIYSYRIADKHNGLLYGGSLMIE